jgi:coproporphyrinogen III oxidase-like Fe-S oxidoreductase
MKVAMGDRPVAGAEELTTRDLALEALMLGFRTAEGFDLVRFRERYGIDLREQNSRLMEKLTEGGLLTVEGDRLLPTLRGWAVADSLARDFEV